MQNKKEIVDPGKTGNCYEISINANKYITHTINKLGLSKLKIRSSIIAIKIKFFLFKKGFSLDLIILNVPDFFS